MSEVSDSRGICSACADGEHHMCPDYAYSRSVGRQDVGCALCGGRERHVHERLTDAQKDVLEWHRKTDTPFGGRTAANDGVEWRPSVCGCDHTKEMCQATAARFKEHFGPPPIAKTCHRDFKPHSLRLPLMVRIRWWWQRRVRQLRKAKVAK